MMSSFELWPCLNYFKNINGIISFEVTTPLIIAAFHNTQSKSYEDIVGEGDQSHYWYDFNDDKQ